MNQSYGRKGFCDDLLALVLDQGQSLGWWHGAMEIPKAVWNSAILYRG
jgi:hypothetical protein